MKGSSEWWIQKLIRVNHFRCVEILISSAHFHCTLPLQLPMHTFIGLEYCACTYWPETIIAWLVVVVVLLSVSISLAVNPRREQMIAMYFDKGYLYQVILLFLAAFHCIIMSMSTLKCILRKNKRRWRRKHSSLHNVGRYIMVSWRKGICIACSSELLYASSGFTKLHSDGVRAVQLFTRLPLSVGKVKTQVQSGYSN